MLDAYLKVLGEFLKQTVWTSVEYIINLDCIPKGGGSLIVGSLLGKTARCVAWK